MPKQLITIEVDYPLLHHDDDELLLRHPPQDWPWMEVCDEYDNDEDVDYRTYTRNVRLVAKTAVTYDDQDRAEAEEAGTTLLELGVHE